MEHYEIAILGAGTAGYTAAIRAAQLGLNSVIIEEDKIGGTCLNYGCIPTKSLIASSETLNIIKKSEIFGISVEKVTCNLEKIIKRKNQIISRLIKGIEFLFKKNKVVLKKGKGTLLPEKKLKINDEIISFDKLILATGSSSFIPDNLKSNSPHVLTSREILNSTEKISSLLIIGGGVIGCEFANIYHSFGTQITIAELAKNILPGVDTEISTELSKIFKKQNISVLTDTSVTNLSEEKGKIKAVFSDGSSKIFDKVLLSVGRSPNLANIGIEHYNLTKKGKYLKVNSNYQTSHTDIFAIGDIIGPPLLAHKASYDAVSLIEFLCDSKEIKQANMPSAIYTHPEIGAVGKTEDELKKNGMDYKKTKFSFFSIGKAKIIDETQGFVKILTHNNIIIGAHIIGHHATELIPALSLAVDNKIPLEKLSETIFAHPTISETIKETFEMALNKSINI